MRPPLTDDFPRPGDVWRDGERYVLVEQVHYAFVYVRTARRSRITLHDFRRRFQLVERGATDGE